MREKGKRKKKMKKEEKKDCNEEKIVVQVIQWLVQHHFFHPSLSIHPFVDFRSIIKLGWWENVTWFLPLISCFFLSSFFLFLLFAISLPFLFLSSFITSSSSHYISFLLFPPSNFVEGVNELSEKDPIRKISLVTKIWSSLIFNQSYFVAWDGRERLVLILSLRVRQEESQRKHEREREK